MYDIDGKLFNGIKSIYVNSLAYVRAKGCKSERFRIDRVVRQVCIVYPWLFDVYTDAVMKELKNGDGEERSEISREGKIMEIAWPIVCR